MTPDKFASFVLDWAFAIFFVVVVLSIMVGLLFGWGGDDK